jgi:hypothetical protein
MNMSENNKNYVFYDLETNGLDYYSTGILQMTMLKYYESPVCLMATLSVLEPSDMFHLVYSTVMTIINTTYQYQLPDSTLIDFTSSEYSQQNEPLLIQQYIPATKTKVSPLDKCSIQ